MVTTRLSEIATSLGSRNNSYSMKFLDEDKSWDLFSEKAFKGGGRSLDLEKIGRKISRRCKGLPLSLVLIGGLLAKSNMSVEYWQTIEENVNSFANFANDEYCLRTLSLSYYHLPVHLKLCFLYMRHTPEDSVVEVSELITTWVSQGFVKPMEGKSLEEAAKIYLEDLVGRNMFLVRRRGKNGNIEACGIHDLLRDLCIKESNKEQLLEVPRILSIPSIFDATCFLCMEQRTDTMLLLSEILGPKYANYGKILMCDSCKRRRPKLARPRFTEVVEISSRNVPAMARCRCLSINSLNFSLGVLRTVSPLWNLEILHIEAQISPFESDTLKEIWEMPQLRHVMIKEFWFSEPVGETDDVVVLENLLTLHTVVGFKCSDDIVRRIPNIRKLGVAYSDYSNEDGSCFHLQNLVHLQKLESLSIASIADSMDFKRVTFPCSLTELTLKGCKVAWDDLTIIGSSLPNLQVLKLLHKSVLGDEWNPVEGEFLRLKYLKLSDSELVRWEVDRETHFPVLEAIVLQRMRALQAIPREIGELPALNLIYLKYCSERLKISAKEMVDEQQIYGNESLKLRLF